MKHIKLIYPNNHYPHELFSCFKSNLNFEISMSNFDEFDWEELLDENLFFIIIFDFKTIKSLINSRFFLDYKLLNKVFMISMDWRIIYPENMICVNCFGAAHYQFIINPVYSIKRFLIMRDFCNFSENEVVESTYNYVFLKFGNNPLDKICDYINYFVPVYDYNNVINNFKEIKINKIKIPEYYISFIKDKGLNNILENYLHIYEESNIELEKNDIVRDYIRFIYNNLD